MKFIYFLIYLTLTTQMVRISVAQYLSPVAKKLHTLCLDNSPHEIKNVEILNALVCGESLNNYNLNVLFIAVGLIHIFVVSGSHLNKIYKLTCITTQFMEKITHPKLSFLLAQLQIIFLLIYCLMCNLNPPVTRSMMILILLTTLKKINLNLSLTSVTLIAGLICLLIEPRWSISLSFQMSWLIQLIVMQSYNSISRNKSIIENFAVYLCLIPTFNVLGFPSIISILIAFALSGVVEFILFPLSFLTYFTHKVAPLFDIICDKFVTVLALFETYTTKTSAHQEQIIQLNWFIICMLHTFLTIQTTQKYREQDSLT